MHKCAINGVQKLQTPTKNVQNKPRRTAKEQEVATASKQITSSFNYHKMFLQVRMKIPTWRFHPQMFRRVMWQFRAKNKRFCTTHFDYLNCTDISFIF